MSYCPNYKWHQQKHYQRGEIQLHLHIYLFTFPGLINMLTIKRHKLLFLIKLLKINKQTWDTAALNN